MKILIADDEQVVRDSLNVILTKAGHTTDTAFDGEEAIGKIKNNLYDLALLDLDMPKLTGYDVLKQARVLYPGLPVIFITATGDTKRVAQSIAKDKLNGFIEKPFTPDVVLDVISKATAHKRA